MVEDLGLNTSKIQPIAALLSKKARKINEDSSDEEEELCHAGR
jgi:hypothetical protein